MLCLFFEIYKACALNATREVQKKIDEYLTVIIVLA